MLESLFNSEFCEKVLTLIWVGFLGVRSDHHVLTWEGGGVKLRPLSKAR